jgi:uncharacterized protein YndB with AHSA1/START domain
MTNPTTITAPEGLPFVEIVREFDAPVAAVYNAWADPALAAQWLGPDGYGMEIETYDFVPGGSWRYLNTDPEGNVYAFHGVFHTVKPGEIVIQTFEWEGLPDHVSLESLRFEPLPGDRTRTIAWSTFPSVEGRDGMIANGMEHGVVEGYARLDGLLT